ncbi:MAG: hypothetical protein WAX69_05345 [Victivallales bacterium]
MLSVTVSGGTGDCDFDVVNPSGTVLRKSIRGSNTELFQIGSPIEGNWLIRLYGVTNYSGLSLMVKYSKAIAVPAAPAVSATDGTYEDRVVITWKPVTSATSYEVWRNTVNAANNTSGNFTKLGDTTDCIFEDSTAAYGTTYYYFAKSENSYYDSVSKSIKAGTSKYSAGNSGYVAKKPAVPGAVTASDGTYFDKIRVSWTKVANATSYMVFRTEALAPAPDPLTATPLAETSALFIEDFGDDIVPQVGGIVQKHYYWIAARNQNAVTVISKPNIGYLSKKGPATISASNGTYSDKVSVSWAAVSGATAYDVYRYTDKLMKENELKVGDAVDCTSLGDDSVVIDTVYYYRVKAKYGAHYDSDFSLLGAMGKAAGATILAATPLANGVGSVGTGSRAKGTALYYSLDVPMGATRMVATLEGVAPPIGLSNDCDLYAKFANFPTKALYGAKGIENKTTEVIIISKPASGTWYFMLYGTTAYADMTLTVTYYTMADIVLTQIPVNDLPVPFTAVFKGKVIDDNKVGIPNIVLQVRNPITGLTSTLIKTDTKGVFSYSVKINSEGEHTFDFFFDKIPDDAKGTASHTVATRKGCMEANNFFDFSAYLPAATVAVPLQADIIGLQNFLNTRNGWGEEDIVGIYETMWVDSTLVKAGDDAKLAAKLDEGLYMFFYGVEGAGAGNDTSTTSALSAVPFVVHVKTSMRDAVLAGLKTLGVIDDAQKTAIETGSIGIVAVVSLNDPEEGPTPVSISLLACEQLELLAKLAKGDGTDVADVKYSDVAAKLVTVMLANGRKINVVAAGFVK